MNGHCYKQYEKLPGAVSSASGGHSAQRRGTRAQAREVWDRRFRSPEPGLAGKEDGLTGGPGRQQEAKVMKVTKRPLLLTPWDI